MNTLIPNFEGLHDVDYMVVPPHRKPILIQRVDERRTKGRERRATLSEEQTRVSDEAAAFTIQSLFVCLSISVFVWVWPLPFSGNKTFLSITRPFHCTEVKNHE